MLNQTIFFNWCIPFVITFLFEKCMILLGVKFHSVTSGSEKVDIATSSKHNAKKKKKRLSVYIMLFNGKWTRCWLSGGNVEHFSASEDVRGMKDRRLRNKSNASNLHFTREINTVDSLWSVLLDCGKLCLTLVAEKVQASEILFVLGGNVYIS